jgi:transaldolase
VLKTGRCFEEVVREICDLGIEHVSAEAVADDVDGLVSEAERIAALGPQVVIKIPMTPDGLRAVSILDEMNRLDQIQTRPYLHKLYAR